MDYRYIYTILLLFLITGCLEDKNHLVDLNIKNENLLLKNLEAISGDYINSETMPPRISVIELNKNLDNYKIFDIRKLEDYQKGHIPNAENISHQDLWSKVETNYSNYSKVVIVSYTGQAASYYTTLLNYAGFNNVFILEFGMCYWNIMFLSYWPNDNDRLSIPAASDFKYIKDIKTFYPLPENENKSPEYIISKIKELLKIDFNDQKMLGENSKGYLTPLTTDFRTLKFSDEDYYLMFYGTLHIINTKESPPLQFDFYPGTIFYIDVNIKSTAFLMTLPPDKTINVYSNSGTESACLVAYLRLLGYNAKNINFGVNSYRSFIHSGTNDVRLGNYFWERKCEDFEVVK